ncbi:class I SAM-dependent methyltransferase [Anaerocolumna sp. AGMB13025]|uniref:class I SAM-dependent methyltransferase n=1 Tax=Anaerocolumna sp. AGMB13025 TaxID=3039116 RepID=UPI00241E96BD|nr:class I SAM-dependent methyltransferase [Anaerocolumna sp. AGMB13025]WFR59481.1 class I SAM-dependent methyltransferase [Anaerocolumna sp. AGMB13025]
MDYVKENSIIWDKRADNNDIWSVPVSSEIIQLAKNGIWSIVLTPNKTVPLDWFPVEIKSKKVLCLASGGGQQGPVMAALGAQVTVFDNSLKQLEKDEYVAKRDGLNLKTIQGDMKDLSAFEDEYFDFIIHPWFNSYVDTVLPVWNECARVLKKNGILIAGFGNPIEYIFDLGELEKGNLVVKHKIPYSDLEHLDGEAVASLCKEVGVTFGHTLTDQIQGQINAGFAIIGFYEDTGGTALDKFIYSSIATKAIKL